MLKMSKIMQFSPYLCVWYAISILFLMLILSNNLQPGKNDMKFESNYDYVFKKDRNFTIERIYLDTRIFTAYLV